MSTAKADLHGIIDSLSEYQARKLKKVISLVVAEFMTADQDDKNKTMLEAFANAPETDEPISDEDLAAIAEAEKDIKAGRMRPPQM
ncbi:hypothetical protein [Sporomusa termitida]|uniref:Uncharacterized protein n=1 Tax=Sporomusa termitida TaxID=2377 RepID=A0A517DXC3_9FIRM|nr:hypothetical protein [Sporomusa termitida]QDR82001.1 hypothetical protein SPTER_34220 [Sporomusa termitida]